jgi:hypothetical protein
MDGSNSTKADVPFDNDALDWICVRIDAIRALIQSLPHEGALTDVDTLLAVAHAEASRHRHQGVERRAADAP